MKRIVAVVGLIALLGGPAWSRDSVRTLFDPTLDPASAPFQDGEKLVYQVHWKPLFATPAFQVGELSVQVENSEHQGRESYRITAHASSQGLLTSAAGLEIRDYFESTIDRHDLRSYRVVKRIREGKRKRDLEAVFDYREGSIRVHEVDLAKQPSEELRRETVEGSTAPLADILSVFYVIRLHHFRKGTQFKVPLANDGKLHDVRVTVVKKEKVTTPIESFETFQLSTTGGLFKGGGDFRIWYSQDSLRVPVKFEADVRFGKVYGDLIGLEVPGLSQGLILTE